MKIETRFNEGSSVIVVLEGDIVRLKVMGVYYESGEISYSLLVSEAATMMDKTVYVRMEESRCFASLGELYNHYLEKLKP